ncbi:MAG TPA: rRNA maturation RNase YbeY [Ferruginibacter sp.]|nr:rRNA maturation RNase YbeY [Chitinophagaceae bacterium]HRI23397.1 rRNA maturation RNase YbeY [Ferruginibacter sp.]
MYSINFHFHDRKYNIRDRTRIKRTVGLIFKKEKRQLGELNYVFCSDKYLKVINNTFLKHNYFTDIITFDLSGPEEEVQGEIYVSIDRVLDNAQSLGVPTQEEICRVIFHGALHLCGFRDKTKAEMQVMRKKEDEYLSYHFK